MTLVELLIVMIVFVVLLSVGLPAYFKLTARANDSAAAANLRAVLPAVAAYKVDHDSSGGYAAMTVGGAGGLKALYDGQLVGWNAAKGAGVTVLSKSAGAYCLKSVAGGAVYYQNGPASPIVASPACV